MVKLLLVKTNARNGSVTAHRASASEGEAARKLLESQGYVLTGPKNKQYELPCPFHEGPGGGKPKSTKFYMNSETSTYYCFGGETKVLTRDGSRPIKELAGSMQMLLTNNPKDKRERSRWVEAEVKSFGVQSLLEVTLSKDGLRKVVRATPEHRWFTHRAGSDKRIETTTEGLSVGHKLVSAYPVNSGNQSTPSPVGIVRGFAFGDGARTPIGTRLDLHGEKDLVILPFIPGFAIREANDSLKQAFGFPNHYKELPSISEATSYLYGWLAGYFAADGSVNANGTVELESHTLENLEFVRDLCTRLGVVTYPIRTYVQDVTMPDGSIRKDVASHRVTLANHSLQESLFLHEHHKQNFLNHGRKSRISEWTIVSIEDKGDVEEVYCAVVPETHAFVLEDFILTGNCQSASCGEKGNLRTLEQFFGVDESDEYVSAFKSRDLQLKEFQANLVPALRTPFYEHGLTDSTIERFRLGYEPEHTEVHGGVDVTIPGRYVIPYLQGRRPKFFRYYNPTGDPKWKYTWESGAEAALYNPSDAMGDEQNGAVILCEGEMKAMLMCQMGYAAVAVPGAGMWKDEWQAAFTHARKIYVCYDNDNPAFQNYDKPDQKCPKCANQGLSACEGHNPGQEAAVKRVDQLGWRAKNVVLPLLDESLKKTDINDFFMRDGASNADFAELATGKRATPFKVQSLAEIIESPPEEAQFLIEGGIISKGGRLLVAGKPKVGKLARISTPVLTPHGWSVMGDIRPGDEVIGVDGKAVKVTHIHPQGIKPIYRVTMSDGSHTECGLEHLWNIQSHNDREYAKQDGRERWRTVDTEAIKSLLDEGRKRDTYIPMVAPVSYVGTSAPAPIDAYALGLLLGDGGMISGTPTFTKPDRELHEALAKALPDQDQVMRNQAKGQIGLSSKGRENTLTQGLRVLGLWGSPGWQKFIPEGYLRASVEDRLAVIQGLCDTDGWVRWNASKKNSSAYFGTSSERLKDGMVELVESLGGQVRVLRKEAPKFQGGVGRPAWTIRIRLPSQFEPFRLTRKLEEWRSGRTSKETDPVRKIVSVEYVDDDEAVCITVANPDGLYVTEHFIVTHNSIFINNLALSLASGLPFLSNGRHPGFAVDHPTRTLLLDRELSKSSLYKRLTQFTDDRPALKAAHENLLIDHDHLVRLDQPNAYDTLLQLIEQNGAEVCILDTAYKFFGGDVESSSSLMKGFAVLDKLIHETGCSFVLTHHLKKTQGGNAKQNNDIADSDAVAGSFLWTGWPNATILLNFMNRSVENPFNSIATFTAFRDAAPPEPLSLFRDRTSISYTAIEKFNPEDHANSQNKWGPGNTPVIKPTTDAVADYLLECSPTTEDDFLHVCAAKFGVSIQTIRPYFIDAMSGGDFERVGKKPPIIRFKHDVEPEQTWEQEHGLPERAIPAHAGASIDEDDVSMFDAASFPGGE